MAWTVLLHPEFDPEFEQFAEVVQDEIVVRIRLLEQVGPQLGRPYADTLNGSKHANMKELRFNSANGVWRVAFAFDPVRQAIILVAGDKSGQSEAKFYRSLIATADKRFDAYLKRLRGRHGA